MEVLDGLDRARILVARGSLTEALGLVELVLAHSPGSPDALMLKGEILLEGRDGEAALSAYEGAAALAPRSARARNGLARCLHALGRDEEALESALAAKRLLEEHENYREVAPVYLTLLWCLRALRRYKAALLEAEEGLSRTPDAILAQWASVVEEELAEAEKGEC